MNLIDPLHHRQSPGSHRPTRHRQLTNPGILAERRDICHWMAWLQRTDLISPLHHRQSLSPGIDGGSDRPARHHRPTLPANLINPLHHRQCPSPGIHGGSDRRTRHRQLINPTIRRPHTASGTLTKHRNISHRTTRRQPTNLISPLHDWQNPIPGSHRLSSPVNR
ncbi:hypothetical protein JOF56_005216 [Kibdelosporangium banguiense]|uniref:Uncharacterized protein n=1 Tax=Kibdelosporangium banguiense TaxID=1365924 RepID=A0ABS4TKD1_9PSEU|nr:hypothetical protein [Kibdelosporangium banguiense]MBP2324831.1 hypothetical protein [Kibdelosporangium banguiense]